MRYKRGGEVSMRVILAAPRGFCAGVSRAIKIAELTLKKCTSVYIRHEIVHNKAVVEKLKGYGAVFIEQLAAIADRSEGATVIFSAHGVSKAVEREAKTLGLRTVDATCPLVKRVHKRVEGYANQGKKIVLIGYQPHVEIEGIKGQVEGITDLFIINEEADIDFLPLSRTDRIAYVTQTTFNLQDANRIIACLKQKFPEIEGAGTNDICYATQNRQAAVRTLANLADIILIVGSTESSNATRLKEISLQEGVPAYMVNDETNIELEWFQKAHVIGVTAGASTPEEAVQNVLKFLCASIKDLTIEELQNTEGEIVFPLPKGL